MMISVGCQRQLQRVVCYDIYSTNLLLELKGSRSDTSAEYVECLEARLRPSQAQAPNVRALDSTFATLGHSRSYGHCKPLLQRP
jgi:hypothetical protein